MSTTDLHWIASEDFAEGARQRAPVIYVHGLGSIAEEWRPQIERLPAGQPWLAYDLRGHGASPKLTSPHSVVDHAKDLTQLLECFPSLQAAHFVGLSLGTMISLEVAAQQPQRCASLFLISAVGDTRLDDFAARRMYAARMFALRVFGIRSLARLIARALFRKPEDSALRADAAARIVANDPKSYRYALAGIPGWTVQDRCPQLTFPVTIVRPEHDFFPRERLVPFTELLPDARLVDLPDLGHAAPIEDPDTVDQAWRSHWSWVHESMRNLK